MRKRNTLLTYWMFVFLFVYQSTAHAILFTVAIAFVGQALLTAAVTLAIGYLVNIALSEDPKSNVTPGGIEDFDFPTTQEGRAVSIVVGEPRIKGYNDIWHGDLFVDTITESVKKNAFGNHKDVTVGYKYNLGLHYAWCAYAEELVELRMDEQVIYDTPVTSNSTIVIDKYNIFGGEKSQGGVTGNISVMFGEPTQPVNTYLSTILGDSGTIPVPAYRGMVTTVAEQLYIGTTVSLKQMDAIWRRTKKTNRGETIWYDSKAEVIDENGLRGMNIAHIVHEIITDQDYSLGYANGFDDTNFQAVADTLYDEGYGLHNVLDVSTNGDNFINEIMGYCSGFRRVNPETNKFELKLMRDDFVVNDLDILDDSNITEITKISRDSATEIFNQVSITFTDPNSRKPSVLVCQNTALIEASGVIVNKDLTAPAVHSPDIANKIATTALQSIGVNPFRMTIKGNRYLAKYNLGDPVVVQMPNEDITNVVVRVLDVDYGDLVNGVVSLTVTQDVFRAGEAVFANPDDSLWEDNSEEPVELTLSKVVELPYYNLVNTVLDASSASLLTSTTGRPITSGVRTAANSTTFDTWAKLSTDSDYTENTNDAVYCPYCTLSAPISAGIAQITIGYSDGIDMRAVDLDGGSWCQINDEILRVAAVDTVLTQITLERGCLDTLPGSHLLGDDVFFISTAFTTSNTEYAEAQTVDVKILPSTTLGTLELGDVTAESLTLNKRYIRPYNGANLAGASNVSDIDFTWAHRNRITGVQDIVLQSATGITPEVGTTYTFIAKDNGAPVRTVSGITAETYIYTEANLIADFGSVANAKVATSTYELKSVRNSHDSWQIWDINGTSIS